MKRTRHYCPSDLGSTTSQSRRRVPRGSKNGSQAHCSIGWPTAVNLYGDVEVSAYGVRLAVLCGSRGSLSAWKSLIATLPRCRRAGSATTAWMHRLSPTNRSRKASESSAPLGPVIPGAFFVRSTLAWVPFDNRYLSLVMGHFPVLIDALRQRRCVPRFVPLLMATDY